MQKYFQVTLFGGKMMENSDSEGAPPSKKSKTDTETAMADTVFKMDNPVILHKIEELYLDSRVSDVKFVFGAGTNHVETVSAHKNILSLSSPMFRTMFFGSLPEQGDVPIVDASAAAFKEFLQFFYLDTVQLTSNHIIDVSRLCHKYGMIKALEFCEESLQKSLTVDELCSAYAFASLLGLTNTKRFCEQKILSNADKVLGLTSFLNCSREIVDKIIQLGESEWSASMIIVAYIAWAKAECKTKNVEATGENIKVQLGSSFDRLPFHELSTIEFKQLKAKENDLLNEVFLDAIITNAVVNKEKKKQEEQRKTPSLLIPSPHMVVFSLKKGWLRNNFEDEDEDEDEDEEEASDSESEEEEEEDMKRFCKQYIRSNAHEISRSDSFLSCNREMVDKMIQLVHSCWSSLQIIEAYIAWAKAECGRKSMEATGENLKVQLGPSFDRIPFAELTMTEFQQLKANNNGHLDEVFLDAIITNMMVNKEKKEEQRKREAEEQITLVCDRRTSLWIEGNAADYSTFSSNKRLLLTKIYCSGVWGAKFKKRACVYRGDEEIQSMIMTNTCNDEYHGVFTNPVAIEPNFDYVLKFPGIKKVCYNRKLDVAMEDGVKINFKMVGGPVSQLVFKKSKF